MAKNKLPFIMSKEQLVKLFEVCSIPKMMIALFITLMCGLRVQETRNIRIEDIDLQRRRLTIRNSKNTNRSREGYGKDRVVPIPEIAISPIKKWLSVVEGKTKWFLPSSKSWNIPVSKEYLENNFAELRKIAKLDTVDYEIQYKKNPKTVNRKRNQYHIKWHSLRHFYAQYVYEKTRDLYAVSDLLGHNQIDTTKIYAKISSNVKKQTVDFAFDNPVIVPVFKENPINNFSVSPIAKREKTPVEILEDRFAKGEISAVDFQTALRLLKVRKDYLDNEIKNEQNR